MDGKCASAPGLNDVEKIRTDWRKIEYRRTLKKKHQRKEMRVNMAEDANEIVVTLLQANSS